MTPSVSWYNSNDSEVDLYVAITVKEEGHEIIYLSCWDSEDKQEVGSIGDQLFVRKLNPDFIVHLNIKEEYYNKWIKVVIYKMKNFDLAEYHCQQIDKAARELKAEISAVCAGGE